MKASIYYTLIIAMFCTVPLCLYEYRLNTEIETEQLKADTLMAGLPDTVYHARSYDSDVEMNDHRSLLDAERKGYLGAAAALFLIPSLMLAFRGRLLKR
ncbi:MAG: hypothetical protein HKL88_05565 [Bacteroidia bacterium]|jgi:hypothetical protein|nr:hypothetical protein [Bacteroidia bacterium]